MRAFLASAIGALCLSAVAAAPGLAKESTHQRHIVQVNCDHSKIDNEETKNTVTVEFWRDDLKLYETTANYATETAIVWSAFKAIFKYPEFTEGPPKCDSNQWAVYISDPNQFPAGGGYEAGKERNPTHFIMRTSGKDGFFMDEVEYHDEENKGNRVDFGASNGKGYCLSKDSGDAKRSWKKYVDGCYPALKFVLKSGKVYPAD
ncbi:hypothetical protein [Rhodobium gokarnense]|uniref:Uncharacterized protein n=1 Tax=Rhodobium gokarnense TaxID=364296 RepID=A0ABT3H5X3_9HYPH|nr:hypothetical protein [Rhodobium gokarnense]MCW2305756.1 hypothetical protein [Rhodobium gokarnense]